tara:strand:- start:327 stop:821 length:495 start_codon:yes stop_codon:yes gene_type:complete
MSGVVNSTGAVSGTIGTTEVQDVAGDYEEGTSTVSFTPGSGTVNMAAGANELKYIKIGKLVHIQGNLDCTGTGGTSPSGDLYISGLPFTSATGGTDTVDFAAIVVKFHNFDTGAGSLNHPQGDIPPNNTIIRISNFTGYTGDSTMADNIQNNSSIMIGGCYTVS